MNEAYVTSKLKESLTENNFYIKKLADLSTKGLPDCFIAKQKRGFFAEIKFLEVREMPTSFQRWSILSKGTKMTQLTTMVLLDLQFHAKYILIYRVKQKMYYCMISPKELLYGWRIDAPVSLPLLVPMDSFIAELNQFILSL